MRGCLKKIEKDLIKTYFKDFYFQLNIVDSRNFNALFNEPFHEQ